MEYRLRGYQQEMVDIGVGELRSGKDKPFILVAATGSGKSLVIAGICHRLNEPTLILQPSKELLLQNHEKMLAYGTEDVKIYSASVGKKEIGKYVMATIGSIYRKPELFAHFKYVIIDECHQVNPKNLEGMYTKFLQAINCTNVCGLTATPYRLQQKYFKENGQLFYTSHLKMINRIHPFFFKKIAYQVETQELIDMGYLCPIKYRADEVNWELLETNSTGADFTEESVERFWNDKRLKKLALTIKMIDKNAKRNLIFCSSIRQAEKAVNMLSDMGVGTALVTSKTPKQDREDIVEQFRSGEIRHLVNVGVFTTGFDVPELDCIVLARPTMSLALYYQMVGRGVRIDSKNPEKMLRVYDFAGCVSRLGRVETIRVVKEEDGWKDCVVSEVGRMDEEPLFKFMVKNNVFKKKETK